MGQWMMQVGCEAQPPSLPLLYLNIGQVSHKTKEIQNQTYFGILGLGVIFFVNCLARVSWKRGKNMYHSSLLLFIDFIMKSFLFIHNPLYIGTLAINRKHFTKSGDGSCIKE